MSPAMPASNLLLVECVPVASLPLMSRTKSSHRIRAVLSLGAMGAALMGGCGPQDLPVDGAEVGEAAQEIVGGTTTAITNAPWQVSLRTASGAHFCGGAILGQWYVLTAQHCVAGRNPATVSLGAGSATRSLMTSTGQVVQVADFLLHPGYIPSTLDMDVALVRLASPLTLNATTVKGITMATAADVTAGRTDVGVIATATGWGGLVPFGAPQDDLRTVDLPISAYTNAAPPLTASMIAAGGVAGQSICHGDSGGPLVVNGASGKLLAGLTSWTAGCGQANHPSVFARVSAIEPWVTNIRSRPVTPRLSEVLSVPTAGQWLHRSFTVAAGTPSLNVRLSGGTGDANLYVHTAAPPTSTFVCTSTDGGTAEYCSIPSPAAGTWYVSVHNPTSIANVTLRATTY
ncbi:peptidase S1 [Corallococcus sp. CA047B]|nr:peptidase S1 [Corallococcus sp. CA047B]